VGSLSVPSQEFFDDFVTWSALEDALKGLRDSQAAEATASSEPVERTVIEASSQTNPVSSLSSSSSSSSGAYFEAFAPAPSPFKGEIFKNNF